MLRYVLRPLLVLLTLGALVVALLQVGGRVLFTLLDDLEVGVNQLLASRNVQVSGLAGDWRMLNPIITVDRARFPAGEVRGLVLEIDMVGSVLRGTPLARRARIEHADVTLEKPAGAPWRLAGAADQQPFDAWPLLRHSEQLEAAGTLRLRREGLDEAAMDVRYVGVNRGGVHRHRLVLHNPPEDCADECVLIADLQARAGLWPLRRGDVGVMLSARGFRLPRALLGASPLHLAVLDASWQRSGRDSGGRVTLHAEQFDMPGQGRLATSLSAAVRGRDAEHRGVVEDWRVQLDDDAWRFPDMVVRADAQGAVVWLPELDLDLAGRFAASALAGVGPGREWLEALQPRGRASNVSAHLRFADAALGYAMRLDELSLEAHKGAPQVRRAAGDLLGFERGVRLNLNADDMDITFPDVFTEGWRLPYARGVLEAWFGRDYFGLRGSGLRTEALQTPARGSFALSRTADRRGQRLLLRVEVDRIDVATAQRFVPYKLPDGLREWLADAPRAGELQRASLAMQGQLQTSPEELGRRLELAADIRGGRVQYHPDWPEVSDVDGRLAVAGSEVRVDVVRARSAGARLGDSRLRLLDNGRLADIGLDAELDGAALLDLVRTTPLTQWLAFVEDDWQAGGALRVSGDLQVPLRAGSDALAVRLRADMEGVDVALPGYRLAFADLDGSWRYRFPAEIDASGVTGQLFDRAVRIAAHSRQQRVHLLLEGRADTDDVWRLLDQAYPEIADGEFDYRAEVVLPAGAAGVPTLTVYSELDGVALRLPAGFDKPADAAEPLDLGIAFRGDHQRLTFSYRAAAGWLSLAGTPLDGAIGFGVPPPRPVPDQADEVDGRADGPGRLVLAGALGAVRLDDVLPPEPDPAALPLTVEFDDLRVAEISLGDFPLTGTRLSGTAGAGGFDLRVDADEVSGRVRGGGVETTMQVELAELRVPSGARSGDPLDASIVRRLPPARVSVEAFFLGDQPFGSWRFALRPEDDVLFIDDLEASVRGVRVIGDAPLAWDAAAGRTRIAVTLSVDDLAGVLPEWGYAPSIETRRARLTGEFTWPGSPAAVDLLTLTGDAEVRAEEGRFLDVESGAGAQRIFSLLNFTAIAKRMSLNFSDVFGRGVSFDTLRSRFSLDQGLLTFVEPMQVEGTGSRFRVSGSVDLAARRLDNDMIVTLPVTRSLPWYAAYVALANPLAGIGVLVGERVLRKPLEQFSSARYRVGGTLDDPMVTFVSVFDVAPAPAEAPAGEETVMQPGEESDE